MARLLILIIISTIFICRAGAAGSSRDGRDYPADLFELIAPGALITTNTVGYSLIGQGGRFVDVRHSGVDWTFIERRTGIKTVARKDAAGWHITRGRESGRITKTTYGSEMTIGGERRMSIKTIEGYNTSAVTNR